MACREAERRAGAPWALLVWGNLGATHVGATSPPGPALAPSPSACMSPLPGGTSPPGWHGNGDSISPFLAAGSPCSLLLLAPSQRQQDPNPAVTGIAGDSDRPVIKLSVGCNSLKSLGSSWGYLSLIPRQSQRLGRGKKRSGCCGETGILQKSEAAAVADGVLRFSQRRCAADGASCFAASPRDGPSRARSLRSLPPQPPVFKKPSLLKHERRARAPLPGEGMGNPTFLLAVM